MTGLPADDALYQHAPCGLLLTDAAGLILRANATLCRWLGVSAATLLGKVRIQDRMPVGARLFHQTHCLPLLQMQGSVAQMQVEIRDSAGQRMPVLINIVRRMADGEIFDEWALFAANERRSYERELVAARKSAEQALDARRGAETRLRALNEARSDADRRKDEFLATLSHELRNPLAPMRSALEVLKLGHAVGADKRPLLDVFDRQLHHLTHLVSTFTVRLPLARVQATPALIGAVLDTVEPRSVLVVDDNVDAAETLQMFLELCGCETRVAHTAGAALGVLEGFTPQVALFDIGLPDMNGYELARQVRLLPAGADLLLIAATGWGQESDKQLALAAGFDHHLTKPVDFDKLRALLAAPPA